MNQIIGYYSTLIVHPQTVQGEYRLDLNDPLYVQDYSESLIPFSADAIFAKNDLTWDPMRKHQGAVDVDERSLIATEFDQTKRRQGSKQAQFKLYKTEYQTIVPEETLNARDIRIGQQSVQRQMAPKTKKTKIRRRELPLYKVGKGKADQLPGTKLKQRLLNGTYEQRDQIKDLLKRLQ